MSMVRLLEPRRARRFHNEPTGPDLDAGHSAPREGNPDRVLPIDCLGQAAKVGPTKAVRNL